MTVRYNQWTGHASQVVESLHRALGQYARDRVQFKVGLTVEPERRWREHSADTKARWSELVVVYETTSARYVSQIEDDLIRHGWNSSVDAESFNFVRGGGGLRQDREVYFIYILLG